MLEENDRMEGKDAIDAERRVMRTKTVVAGDDVTSLRNELRQLREQIAAMTTIKSAMRTTTNAKPCNKCNVPHRGECYGKAIATGKLTMEQAAEKFAFIIDPARRPAAATAALKRNQDYQAQKGGGKPQAGQARVHVCHDQGCYNVDLRSATSPGFAQGDGHVVLFMDSNCDQHMFNDMRWFHSKSTPSLTCWSRPLRRAYQPLTPEARATPS
eukprot:6213573-Pleurochrysis_carterae.AAC.1